MQLKAAQLCLTPCDPMNYTVHGFSKPEYWSREPFPTLGDLPNPGIDPRSPTLQAGVLYSLSYKMSTVIIFFFIISRNYFLNTLADHVISLDL